MTSNDVKDTTETNERKPLTVTCSNCGGSGIVRCYDCEYGYKVNSWGDKVMCDCNERFKRECRHCAGTGEVKIETPATEQQPDQPRISIGDRAQHFLSKRFGTVTTIDKPRLHDGVQTVWLRDDNGAIWRTNIDALIALASASPESGS